VAARNAGVIAAPARSVLHNPNENLNMAIEIEFHRTRDSLVFADGKRVGEIFKIGTGGFGLRLQGIYWLRGVMNRRGGNPSTAFRLRREAVAAARLALES
jgi:hypothetical protein